MAHSQRWFALAQGIDWTSQDLDKRSVKALQRALGKTPDDFFAYLGKVNSTIEAKVRKALCLAEIGPANTEAEEDSAQTADSIDSYVLLDDLVDEEVDVDRSNCDDGCLVSAPVNTFATPDLTPSGYAVQVVATQAERLAAHTANLVALLSQLCAYQPYSQPFLEPVPRSVPDYYDVITHPMDLSTMRAKAEAGDYGFDVTKFADDLYLIFGNCRRFNEAPEAQIYVQHANQTQALANRLLTQLPRLFVARETKTETGEETGEISLSEQLSQRIHRRQVLGLAAENAPCLIIPNSQWQQHDTQPLSTTQGEVPGLLYQPKRPTRAAGLRHQPVYRGNPVRLRLFECRLFVSCLSSIIIYVIGLSAFVIQPVCLLDRGQPSIRASLLQLRSECQRQA
eukprot:m.113664 g.113664  ORF g.113664 m.113664 type:complete len:396 (+) comp15449_c0_seq4:1-1188(+)